MIVRFSVTGEFVKQAARIQTHDGGVGYICGLLARVVARVNEAAEEQRAQERAREAWMHELISRQEDIHSNQYIFHYNFYHDAPPTVWYAVSRK